MSNPKLSALAACAALTILSPTAAAEYRKSSASISAQMTTTHDGTSRTLDGRDAKANDQDPTETTPSLYENLKDNWEVALIISSIAAIALLISRKIGKINTFWKGINEIIKDVDINKIKARSYEWSKGFDLDQENWQRFIDNIDKILLSKIDRGEIKTIDYYKIMASLRSEEIGYRNGKLTGSKDFMDSKNDTPYQLWDEKEHPLWEKFIKPTQSLQ